MAFTVSSLPIEPFSPLFALDDEALALRGMLRVVADAPFAFPCRVTLDDAEPGERLILLNYEHQPADSPFRSAHAIYVREGRRRAGDHHRRPAARLASTPAVAPRL